MKVTYALPKEGDPVAARAFLLKEIDQARNIKKDVTRSQVEKGLARIRNAVEVGKIFRWDGENESMLIERYLGKEKIYHCGREFVNPPPMPKSKYLLIVMDANECTIALLNGKRIDPLWHKESNVPRKQDAGGQSAVRFQRNRELALKLWYKEIADKMRDIVLKNQVK